MWNFVIQNIITNRQNERMRREERKSVFNIKETLNNDEYFQTQKIARIHFGRIKDVHRFRMSRGK